LYFVGDAIELDPQILYPRRILIDTGKFGQETCLNDGVINLQILGTSCQSTFSAARFVTNHFR